MKLLFHMSGHHKIIHSVQQMCASIGWTCEFTRSDARLHTPDYDIVIMNSKYIPPEEFPPNVKIIYGPQHWLFPQGPLLGETRSEYRCRAVYNVLSEWVKEVHHEVSGPLIVPRVCFPFSVDVDRFCPVSAPVTSTTECMVYIKRRHPAIVSHVCDFLREKGITTLHIYKYGSYTEANYMRDLQRVRFMVVLDAHESQGYALEEAMSCNVPLFVMDATSMYDEVNERSLSVYAHMRPKKLTATSVPYWSDKCGVRFTDLSELPAAFEDFTKKLDAGEFAPREYVLETLSPVACMRRIIDYFHLPT